MRPLTRNPESSFFQNDHHFSLRIGTFGQADEADAALPGFTIAGLIKPVSTHVLVDDEDVRVRAAVLHP